MVYTHDKYGKPLSLGLSQVLNDMTIPLPSRGRSKTKGMHRGPALRISELQRRRVYNGSVPSPQSLADVPPLVSACGSRSGTPKTATKETGAEGIITDKSYAPVGHMPKRSHPTCGKEPARKHPLARPRSLETTSTLAPINEEPERQEPLKTPLSTPHHSVGTVTPPTTLAPAVQVDVAAMGNPAPCGSELPIEWLRMLVTSPLVSEKHEDSGAVVSTTEIDSESLSLLSTSDSSDDDDDSLALTRIPSHREVSSPIGPLDSETDEPQTFCVYDVPPAGPVDLQLRPRTNSDYYRQLAMERAMCRNGKLRTPLVSVALAPRTDRVACSPRPPRRWRELSAADFTDIAEALEAVA